MDYSRLLRRSHGWPVDAYLNASVNVEAGKPYANEVFDAESARYYNTSRSHRFELVQQYFELLEESELINASIGLSNVDIFGRGTSCRATWSETYGQRWRAFGLLFFVAWQSHWMGKSYETQCADG